MPALLLLLCCSSAQPVGEAKFNDAPNAHPTLSVNNVSVYPDTRVWYPEVDAQPGDTVAFAVAYVNTAWAERWIPAVGTKVRFSYLHVEGGIVGTATVWADNAEPVSGRAFVRVPGAGLVTLSPLVSGEWWIYDKQRGLPGGPSTFRLGTVRPGWATSGHVVLRFRVEGSAEPAPVTPPDTGGGGSS